MVERVNGAGRSGDAGASSGEGRDPRSGDAGSARPRDDADAPRPPAGSEGRRGSESRSHRKSEEDEAPKVVPLDSLRRRGVLRDPYKFGVLLQIFFTLLLISLLIYCLFPFFAMMDKLDVPTKRVIYIPIAIVAVVLFFVRRAVRLVRRLREGGP
jgi:hypothetical protein